MMKISKEPQIFIKTSGEISKLRVKFAQCAWPLILVVAAIWSLIVGGHPTVVLTAYFVSVLPFLAWLAIELSKSPIGQSGANLISIIWVFVSFASIAVSGGILSPMTIVLALGPLSLVGLDRPREALEAALLGAVGFFGAVVVGFAGWSESAPVSWRVLQLPWAFVAIVQMTIFAWACRSEQPRADSPPVKTKDSLESLRQHLEFPFVLIDVSDLGRIREILGADHLTWPDLQEGRLAESLLPSDGQTVVASPSGETFAVVERVRSDGGKWIALIAINNSGASGFADASESEESSINEAVAERTAFFAGLGHDLKTPLNAILGFADLMKAEVRGPMPEPYKDYPAIIHESGQDLLLLVEDMLDLAKSEAKSHRLEIEPIDLSASAASILRQLQDQADRADVKLVQARDSEVWADADPRAVRQIWQNLISNAIKYSEPGDNVTVSTGLYGASTYLSVEDNGAGMTQEDLDRVAKPFAQGTNSKGRAGTGLGLAVVQRFAELHGGQVIIDTAPGKGTRVRVMLPAATNITETVFGDAAQ
ncbi:MAG: HAMP domain-containing sensor histidine kinase [Pseudomonadota bacterium]